MTEYQEKQWNIFICNVSFSLFNFTQASSPSLPLILHWHSTVLDHTVLDHTVLSKIWTSYSCFFEIIRCPPVVITSFWPLAVLISAITSQRCLENWMLQSPLSQQSRKLCLVKLNLNYHGLCRKMTESFSEYSSVISVASSCNDDLAYVWHLKYIIML